jgi:hypothetical protein
MNYWLIVFLFDVHGEFIDKKEIMFPTYAACEQEKIEMLESIQNAEAVCVTDDHYTGRRQDPGIAYD